MKAQAALDQEVKTAEVRKTALEFSVKRLQAEVASLVVRSQASAMDRVKRMRAVLTSKEEVERGLLLARRDFESLASVRATRAGGWKDRWAAASPEMQQAVDAHNLIPYADQAKRKLFVDAIAPQKMLDWSRQYRGQLRGIDRGR